MRKVPQDAKAQYAGVQWVQLAETKECKAPDAEPFDEALVEVRRDHEPAQHEKEVDKQITVLQQRDIGKVAAGLSSEMIAPQGRRRFPASCRARPFPLIHAQP